MGLHLWLNFDLFEYSLIWNNFSPFSFIHILRNLSSYNWLFDNLSRFLFLFDSRYDSLLNLCLEGILWFFSWIYNFRLISSYLNNLRLTCKLGSLLHKRDRLQGLFLFKTKIDFVGWNRSLNNSWLFLQNILLFIKYIDFIPSRFWFK